MNTKSTEWFYHYIQYCKEINQIKKTKASKEIFDPNLDNSDNFSLIFTKYMDKDNERSIYYRIIELIEKAKKDKSFILISSFILNYTEIINQLIDACKIIPGRVFILIGKEANFNYSISSDGKTNLDVNLAKLANTGALIRCKNHAHLKFIVCGNSSIITSANLTSDALNINPEFGLFFDDDKIISNILKLIFTKLWHEKSEKVLIEKRWNYAPRWIVSEEIPAENLSNLFLSSKTLIEEINATGIIVSELSLLEKIEKMIDEANSQIDISVYIIEKGNKKKSLRKLINKLKEKAKTIPIRILVPVIKVRTHKNMRDTLDELNIDNIDIKYYKELHGKSLVIDNKEVLIFTGNIEKHLKNSDSFDIGFSAQNDIFVENFCKLYNELWERAEDDYNIPVECKLQIDLAINNPEYISKKHKKSIVDLQELLNKSNNIEWYFSEDGSLLSIDYGRKYPFKIPIKHNEDFELDTTGEFVLISGIFDPDYNFNIKNKPSFQVKNLEIRCLWQNQ